MDIPLGRQLAITSKAMRAHADTLLADHDANLTTWIVLFHADLAPAPGLSQRQLADDMSIGSPALVRHLDRLEADGHVKRTRDTHDRRITRISLTPKGRRHLSELRVVMEATDREIRGVLTATEVRTLERALHKLLDHVSTHPPDETDAP